MRIPLLTNIHTSLVLAWAIRFLLFLFHREFVSWPEYHAQVLDVNKSAQMEPKIPVWITCSVFYFALFSPAYYRLHASANSIDAMVDQWGIVGMMGIVLQVAGLLLESISDVQKTLFKGQTPKNLTLWCNVGLWKYSTHPNYLGELTFWIGTYLGGVGGMRQGYRQRLISFAGVAGVFVVMNGARRSLDRKQVLKYGEDPEFLMHRSTTGLFGPFGTEGKTAIPMSVP